MRKPPLPPLLVLVFGTLAVAAASVMIRFAQQEAPSLVVAAWRLLLAALVLAPLAVIRCRGELSSLTGSERTLALVSGVFLALHFATWITSLAYTSVASSVVLVATAPLWVALLSPITLKERLSRHTLAGLLLALVGSFVVGIGDSCTLAGARLSCPALGQFVRGDAFWGDLLALAGAFLGAGYLLIGRKLRRRISLLGYVSMVYSAAAVVLVLLTVAAGQPLFGYSPATYMWLAALALVPQLLGHSSYNWALAYLSAAYVSIAVLGEPVGSTILAYFILGEKVTTLKMFGAVLILAGIYVCARSESGSERGSETGSESPAELSV